VPKCLPSEEMIQMPPGRSHYELQFVAVRRSAGLLLASSRDAVDAVNLQLLLRVIITLGGAGRREDR
jgi:hypothetical protein